MDLNYASGTIIIRGDARMPNSTWDERSKTFRAMGLHYRDIREYIENSGMNFRDYVLDLVPCPKFKSKIVLRDYQKQALDAWASGRRGVIVLPTGSGKTVIGIKAIELVNAPTLVVAPTLDLVNQWQKRLSQEFKTGVGILGGGEQDIKPITVSTYDSAYIHAGRLGNKFGLIIFDEVHHLPAEGYRQIAEMFAAPYRLGLTATYEREDGLHTELARLVGGKVFEKRVNELAGRHLSPYTLEKIAVEITPDERKEYDENQKIYSGFVNGGRNRFFFRGMRGFQRLVMMSGRNPEARRALLARNRAREIALNSSSKLVALASVLKNHKEDRVFIFTEHNRLVHRISNQFLIPSITYRTVNKERVQILDSFRSGEYKAIVTSRVLDEGIDVPDANVGVILSGTGSERAFVQRLGRILRKKEGKEAVLYEIISSETSEVGSSSKRKKAIR